MKIKCLTMLIATMAIAVVYLSGCSSEKEKTPVNNKSTTWSIELKANASTGYTWQYTIDDEAIVKCTKDEYLDSQQISKDGINDENQVNNNGSENSLQAVGAGGQQCYTFEAIAEGTTEIHLEYAQHWDGGSKGEVRDFTAAVDSDGYVAVREKK